MYQNTVKQKESRRSIRRKRRKFTIRFFLVLAMAMLFLTAPLATSPVLAQEDIIHIVKPGESLSSIAARYGINMYALARYNGIRNINYLRIGQRLQIPGTTVAPAPVRRATPIPTRARFGYKSPSHGSQTPPPTPYVVDRNHPTPTRTPVVPSPTPRRPTIRIHVVTAFDTLTSIANLYGTSAWAIRSRNGLPGDRIYRGQRLIIP